MTTKITWQRGTTLQTLLTAASDVTNNSLYKGSAITLTDSGFVLADIVFSGSFGSSPGASTALSIWLLLEDGSSNYEDGDGSISGGSDITPARNPDFVIPVRAATGTQVVIRPRIVLPPGPFKVLMKNDGTGQTLSSTATIKAYAATYQQG